MYLVFDIDKTPITFDFVIFLNYYRCWPNSVWYGAVFIAPTLLTEGKLIRCPTPTHIITFNFVILLNYLAVSTCECPVQCIYRCQCLIDEQYRKKVTGRNLLMKQATKTYWAKLVESVGPIEQWKGEERAEWWRKPLFGFAERKLN